MIYVAAERAKLTERRFAALRKHYGVDDLPLAVIAGSVDFLTNRRHIDEIAGYAAELKQSSGWPVVLIVVDTVSRVMNGGDENSPKDMGALVANIARLQEATGAHVLLIHHVPQDGNNVRLRGHGALLGALDTVVAIEKGATVHAATVIKDNDGADDQRLAFTLQSVSLSIDPDTLEETTAPIVLAAEQAPNNRKALKRQQKLSASAQTALRALDEAIGESGETPTASNHIPAHAKCVTIERWKEHAFGRGISASDKDASRLGRLQPSERHSSRRRQDRNLEPLCLDRLGHQTGRTGQDRV